MPRFVDTNVLIYAISRLPEDAEKGAVARELLRSRDLALSAQVLQEFYVQATRTPGPGQLSHEHVTAYMVGLQRYPIQALTPEVVWTALGIRERYQVNYWDAAILAAARLSGCETLLTEDLSDGQDYGGVRVANPFAVA